MAVDAGGEWVPAQYPKEVDAVDLRRLTAVAPKGFKERTAGKRKRAAEDEEAAAAAGVAPMQEDDAPGTSEPSEKRQKADEKTFRPVSGKKWKAPGQKASTVMKPAPTRKTWNRKMTEKAATKHLKEVKANAVAAAKAKRKAKADQRKAAKERKQENQKKSAVVQKITNAATVKKMMKDKKQRKLLRTADTN